MSKLAIDGGSRVFPDGFSFEPWPPVNEETADKLRQVYLGHKWSFYGQRKRNSRRHSPNIMMRHTGHSWSTGP